MDSRLKIFFLCVLGFLVLLILMTQSQQSNSEGITSAPGMKDTFVTESGLKDSLLNENSNSQSSLVWKYWGNKSPSLHLTIKDKYSKTGGHHLALIVIKGDKYYGSDLDNYVSMQPCYSTPDSVEFCRPSLSFSSLQGREVTAYVLLEMEKSLTAFKGSNDLGILMETNPKKMIKLDLTVPFFDEKGFISDSKYADRSWCWFKTNVMEYGDFKPKCQELLDQYNSVVPKKVNGLGGVDEPIEIIQYVDFEDIFSFRFYQNTYPLIKSNYLDNGKAVFIVKNFPLNYHSNAMDAAKSFECSRILGDEDTPLEMYGLLFEGYDNGITVDSINKMAEVVGLNLIDFTDCLNEDSTKELISGDINSGNALGVSGTPTFFINGEKLVGAQDYSKFEEKLNSEK